MAFRKKIFKFKKLVLGTKAAFLVSLAISSCALPINRLDSSLDAIESKNNALSNYPNIQHSQNYYKKIEKWTPNQVDNGLDDKNQYTSEYLITGKNYIDLVNGLTDKDIENDLKDYLIEETQTKPISIDFNDSWEFDFQTISGLDKKIIQNFRLQFNITNYGPLEITLLESLTIAPLSNAKVLISFGANTGSSIEPWYVLNSSKSSLEETKLDNHGTYAASWIINIKKNPKIEIIYNEGILKGETKNFSLNNRWFAMSGKRSYALAKNFINFYNLPNYLSIQNLALKKFQEMTVDDYIDDLMDWYLTYYRYQYYLALKDIKFIIEYFFIENLQHPTEKNKLISIVEYAMLDKNFRKTIFDKFNFGSAFDTILKKLLEGLFSEDEKKKITYEEFYAIMNHIKNLPIDEFIDNGIEVEFIWKQKPILNLQDITQPKISFDFEIKTNIKKDLYIETIGSTKYKEKVVNFDFSKVIDMQDLIQSMVASDNPLFSNANGLITLINYLLPHTFGVRENESYSINVKAIESPIQFYSLKTFAFIKKTNVKFGWAATDVKIDLNFSGLKFLWESIARKLDNYNLEKSYPEIVSQNTNDEVTKRHAKKDNELNKIAYEQMKKLPKKEHLNIVNATTLANQMNDGLQVVSVLNDLYNKPFSDLLKGLVRNAFSIDSFQLEVGISRAFYDLPKEYQQKPLWVKKNNNSMHFLSNPELSLTSVQNDNKEFDFKLLSKELEKINASYSQEIYDITKFDWTWDQKDLNEKVQNMKNDELFLENINKYVKESFLNSIKVKWDAENSNETFLEEHKNINPLEKFKISLVKVDLLGAFKSVMNSKTKIDGIIGAVLGNNIFGVTIIDFSKLPDALVKRNAWIVIINSGTTALPTQTYIVPPVLDFDNIFENIKS